MSPRIRFRFAVCFVFFVVLAIVGGRLFWKEEEGAKDVSWVEETRSVGVSSIDEVPAPELGVSGEKIERKRKPARANWRDHSRELERVDGSLEPDGWNLRKRVLWVESLEKPVFVDERVWRDGVEEERSTLLSARVANELVLSLEDLESPEEPFQIARELGMQVSRFTPSGRYAILESDLYGINEYEERLVLARALSGELGVLIEPNHVVQACDVIPNDSLFGANQWALNNSGSRANIKALQGWKLRTNASGVVVAVVDTGIRATHEDLVGNIWVNSSEIAGNGIDDDGNGFVDDITGANFLKPAVSNADDDGHGTHVSGIVGAMGNNRVGVAGVAWKVKLMALKALNEEGLGTNEAVSEAVDYAVKHGARLINMSLGSTSSSELERRAIARARDAGVIVIAAAGNDGKENAEHYPSGYSLDNIVSVGSANYFGDASGFSNFGTKSVDLFAPGSDIFSTYYETNSDYASLDGTSMAAPMVTGALALGIARYPNETYEERLLRLRLTVNRISSLTWKSDFGGTLDLAAFLSLEDVAGRPRVVSSSSVDAIAYEGNPWAFEASFYSSSELTYQWYFDGELITEETSPRLEFAEIGESDEGVYRLVASNDVGETAREFRLRVSRANASLTEAAEGGSVAIYTPDEAFWNVDADPSSEGGTHIASSELELNKTYRLAMKIQGPVELRFDGEFGDLWNRSRKVVLKADDHSFTLSNYGNRQSYRVELWEERIYFLELEVQRFSEEEDTVGGIVIDRIRTFEYGKAPPYVRQITGPSRIRVEGGGSLRMEAGYQPQMTLGWEKDGRKIEEEGGFSLSFSSVTMEDAGFYQAVVTNEFGTDKSPRFELVIPEDEIPARFSREEGDSLNFYAMEGDSTLLSAVHVGTPPIEYIWWFKGAELDGADFSELLIPSARLTQSGTYLLGIFNEFGSDWMNINLSVSRDDVPPKVYPELFKRPNYHMGEGDSLDLSYEVSGTPPLSLQWYKDGVPVSGETGNDFEIDSLLPSDAGEYVLEVRNLYGVDRSEAANVTVLSKGLSELDYADFEWSKDWGSEKPSSEKIETIDGVDSLRFSLSDESGRDAKSLSLQLTGPANYSFWWKRNDEEGEFECLIGEDGQARRLAVLTTVDEWTEGRIHVPEGEYQVVWKFGYAQKTKFYSESKDAWLDQLQRIDKPAFIQPDLGVVLIAGMNTGITKEAWGVGPLTYQWLKNDIPLAGETSSTLVVNRNDVLDTDRYTLKVESTKGVLESQPMRLVPVEGLMLGDAAKSIRLGKGIEPLLSGEGDVLGLRGDGSRAEECWIELEVEGPASLLADSDLYDWNVTVGGANLSQDDLGYRFIPTGNGVRTIRISLKTNYLPFRDYQIDDYWARLSGLDLGARTRFLDVPDALNPINDQERRILFRFTSSSDYEAVWLRNGEEMPVDSYERHVAQGYLYSFDELLSGDWVLRVTDEDGAVFKSNPITVFDPKYGYGEVLDFEAGEIGLSSDYYVRFDEDVFYEGETSLRLEKRDSEINQTTGLSYSGRKNVRIRMKVRVQDEGSYVRVKSDGMADKLVELSSEWIEVGIPGWSSSVRFDLSHIESDDFVFWLDGFESDESDIFVRHPYDQATFLGGWVALEVDVRSGLTRTYQWRKDGVPIPGAKGRYIEIEEVGLEDLGFYDCVCVTDIGTYTSDAAKVTLASDLGAAIGQPGLKVSTWGQSLWRIDDGRGHKGGNSLVAGSVDPGQESGIRFYFDRPVFVGYMVEESDDSRASETVDGIDWRYGSDIRESSEVTFVYKAQSGGEGGLANLPTRIDSLEILDTNFVTYDSWAFARRDSWTGPFVDSDVLDRRSDPDRDGIPNWIEFSLGLDPFEKSELPRFELGKVGNEAFVNIEYDEALSGDSRVLIEFSEDLVSWRRLDLSESFEDVSTSYRHVEARLGLDWLHDKQTYYRFRVIGVGGEAVSGAETVLGK